MAIARALKLSHTSVSTTLTPTTTNSSSSTETDAASKTTKSTKEQKNQIKRKPVRFVASTPSRSSSRSSSSGLKKKTKSVSALVGPPSAIPTSDILHPQNHRGFVSMMPLHDASGLGLGMSGGGGSSGGIGGGGVGEGGTHGNIGYASVDSLHLLLDSPQHKSFEETQEELYAKLTDLAKAKNGGRTSSSATALPSMAAGSSSTTSFKASQPNGALQNKHLQNTQLRPRGSNGSTTGISRPTSTVRRPSKKGIASHSTSNLVTNPSVRREPRRKVNSAQFRTPSVADMQELAQVVVANATPPKSQNQKKVIRKKPSILSMTTTTFGAPSVAGSSASGSSYSTNSNINNLLTIPGNRMHDAASDYEYRLLYEDALKEIQALEKKFSALQQQLAYERDSWQEMYNELERRFEEQQNIKAEAQTEKMNELLDTVQELQLANECFRRQLKEADIEPNPTPAAEFHSQFFFDDDLERSIIEQNQLVNDRSLASNKHIAVLSTEITNSCVAISQTINHMQLQFLKQTLHSVEHVAVQKRTRAMSNSFLSDMLGRGVKKHGANISSHHHHHHIHSSDHHSHHQGRTVTASTQTPPSIMTSFRSAEEQQQFQQFLMYQQQVRGGGSSGPGGSSLGGSRFTQSLLSLVGLQHHHNHHIASDKDDQLHQFRLKGRTLTGWMMDDRSQSITHRSGVNQNIVQDLKGGPASPVNAEAEDAISNKHLVPAPRFQYASPTTSQLRIIVPDVPALGHSSTTSSTTSSISRGVHQNANSSMTNISAVIGPLSSGGPGGSPYYFGRPVAKIIPPTSATTAPSTSGGEEDDDSSHHHHHNHNLHTGLQPLKRSASDISLHMQVGNSKYSFAKTKYPYPYHHSSLFAAAAAEAVSSTLHGSRNNEGESDKGKQNTQVLATDCASDDGVRPKSALPVLQVVSPC
ncbi:hypothetical protein BGW42_001253 [Actinomortierella wolfii]|nr:hypothetical protein BGW42_001253 [Actinomortierella wolfii]